MKATGCLGLACVLAAVLSLAGCAEGEFDPWGERAEQATSPRQSPARPVLANGLAQEVAPGVVLQLGMAEAEALRALPASPVPEPPVGVPGYTAVRRRLGSLEAALTFRESRLVGFTLRQEMSVQEASRFRSRLEEAHGRPMQEGTRLVWEDAATGNRILARFTPRPGGYLVQTSFVDPEGLAGLPPPDGESWDRARGMSGTEPLSPPPSADAP